MPTIHRSSQLAEFAKFTHETLVATTLACGGLQRQAKQIGKSSQNPSNNIYIGSNRPGSGGPLGGVMKVRDLVKHSKKGGHFTNLLCSNALVAIYTEWDEIYRKFIA